MRESERKRSSKICCCPVYNAIFLMVMLIVNITASPCNNFVFHIVYNVDILLLFRLNSIFG